MLGGEAATRGRWEEITDCGNEMTTGTRVAGPPTERARSLTDAVRAFADASVDYPRLLEIVAKTAAELLECACAVSLVSADGRQVETMAVYDGNPSAMDLVRELAGANPLSVDAQVPSTQVLTTGEELLILTIDASLLAARLREQDWERARALEVKSCLIAPLKAHGKTIGVLTLVRHGSHAPPHDEHDAAIARSLADHAGLAMTNARLLAEATRLTARLRLLTELAREF